MPLLDLRRHHHPIDYLGDLNGLISGITLYPQLYHAYASNSLAGLSLITFILILFNSIIWIAYAIHRNSTALLISSCLNAFASLGITLVLILK